MVRKSRRKSSIIVQGRLIIEEGEGNSEDEYPEAEVGGASPPPSEADWIYRQQELSPIQGSETRVKLLPDGALPVQIRRQVRLICECQRKAYGLDHE